MKPRAQQTRLSTSARRHGFHRLPVRLRAGRTLGRQLGADRSTAIAKKPRQAGKTPRERVPHVPRARALSSRRGQRDDLVVRHVE